MGFTVRLFSFTFLLTKTRVRTGVSSFIFYHPPRYSEIPNHALTGRFLINVTETKRKKIVLKTYEGVNRGVCIASSSLNYFLIILSSKIKPSWAYVLNSLSSLSRFYHISKNRRFNPPPRLENLENGGKMMDIKKKATAWWQIRTSSQVTRSVEV